MRTKELKNLKLTNITFNYYNSEVKHVLERDR